MDSKVSDEPIEQGGYCVEVAEAFCLFWKRAEDGGSPVAFRQHKRAVVVDVTLSVPSEPTTTDGRTGGVSGLMTCTKTAEKGKTTRAYQIGIEMRQVALRHAAHIILFNGK